MPIVASDIQIRLSGGAANADPLLSIGGAKSSVQAGTNIFDNVSSAEASAGDVEYRCVYLHNNHGTLTLTNGKLWIQVQTPSADTDVAIGLAVEGLNATAAAVADENTAPASVVFTAPSNLAGGLTLPSIPAGQHIGVWIRRTVNAAAGAYTNDGFTLRVQGDSTLV